MRSKYGFGLLFFLLLFACSPTTEETRDSDATPQSNDDQEIPVAVDLSEIKERDTLKAIIVYGPNSYYIYRGRPMGFEYELLTRLAEHLGVELKLNVVNDLDNVFTLLNRGEGDILAHWMTVTKEREEQVEFTNTLLTTKQVLVQQLPDDWRKMKLHEIDKLLIRNPLKLVGKDVYVRKESAYADRLENLSQEIGGDINVQFVSGDLSTETLIRQVSGGEIPLTVADKNIARLNATYLDNIDVKTAISFPQKLAWATRKNSPELLSEVNKWITQIKKAPDFKVIYNRYYNSSKNFNKRIESEYSSVSGGKISSYDGIIKEQAKMIKWDWRLLASQIYQESKFDAEAESWAGAQGLMQMMPATAESFGVTNIKDPKQSIKGGVAYLGYLLSFWESIPDNSEKIKFVLASYNVGENHVKDAQRLAKAYGADPSKWENNVAKYLQLKSRKAYYNHKVVKYGYCRGNEPVNYVKEILKRYETYKQLL